MKGRNYRKEFHDRSDPLTKVMAQAEPVPFYEPARWEWEPLTGRADFSGNWHRILEMAENTSLQEAMDSLFSRMHEQDACLLQEAARRVCVGSNQILDIPVRLLRFDQTWVWVLFKGERKNQEVPATLQGICIEVSQLRLYDHFFPPQYNSDLSSYQSLLNNSPNYIVRYDRELFPLYINPAVEGLVQVKPEERGSKKLAELEVGPEDLEFCRKAVQRVFETGEVLREKTRFGKGRFVLDFCFWPEFDADGVTVRSVISQAQDLTDEVRQERLLRLNEQRSSALYQLTQMHDATEEELARFVVMSLAVLTDSEYSQLYVPRSKNLTGGYTVWYARGGGEREDPFSAAGDPPLIWREFNEPDDGRSLGPLIPGIVNDASQTPPRYFFGDKQAVSRYMYASSVEDGKVVAVVAVYNRSTVYTEEDLRQLTLFLHGAWLVMRRRGWMDDLMQAKEAAEQANKVKDRFLANVSHELRTPLNGLLSMLQLLEFSDLTQEQREFAQNAMFTGKTLLRIISDILDFSRLNSGNVQLNAAPFDLRNTIESTLHLFREEANRKGLMLESAIEGSLPELLSGDEARIRQILFNLIGNSLKFTEEGYIRLHCSCLETGENDKVWIYLAVDDSGIGIPMDMQTKVFSAFTQVDNQFVRGHQGTGLGLGIVRGLVEHMGGKVTLESLPGEGTTVHCTLALEKVSQEDLDEAGNKAETGPTNDEPLVVLIAEDDRVSQIALNLFLKRLGHTVVSVDNGRHALELLQLYPFDCLISDVLMPEMDGLELTRRIRRKFWKDIVPNKRRWEMLPEELRGSSMKLHEIPPDLPIVTASAHAMSGDRERFLEEGMDYYLSKPLSIAELSSIMSKIRQGKSLASGGNPG